MSEKCTVCEKRVYEMEKLLVDGTLFHKWCFKCKHCNKTLGLGEFASMNREVFCKPHFKQLFKAKGNYDEGFGRERHTKKWDASQAPVQSKS